MKYRLISPNIVICSLHLQKPDTPEMVYFPSDCLKNLRNLFSLMEEFAHAQNREAVRKRARKAENMQAFSLTGLKNHSWSNKMAQCISPF